MQKLITNAWKNVIKKKWSYLKYWDVNDLYCWGKLQKLQVNKFEWIEDTSHFNEDFIKNYIEESNEGYFLEVDVQFPEKLHELHDNLPILPERMKLKKAEKLVANLHDNFEYVIQIKNLEKALNLWKKFIAWLKPCIDMNTKRRQRVKNN